MSRKLLIAFLFTIIYITSSCKQNVEHVLGIMFDSNTTVIDEKVVFTNDTNFVSAHQSKVK